MQQQIYDVSLTKNKPLVKKKRRIGGGRIKYSYSFAFTLFFLSMLIPLFFLEYNKVLTTDNTISLVSFLFVGSWSFICLYFAASKRPFTLNCSHWLFFSFFLFYAPITQFLMSYPPDQTNTGNFDELSFETNLLLIIWCAVYSLTYSLTKTYYSKQQSKPKKEENAYIFRINYVVLVAISVAALAASYYILGSSLFSRALMLDLETAESSGKATTLIVNIIFRSIPTICFAISLYDNQHKTPFHRIAIVFIGLLALMLNNPLAVARFWFGASVIGILCILLRNKRWTSLWLPVSLVFSLIYLLPLLNLGRYDTFSEINLGEYQNRGFASSLVSGDFDAYSMFVNTIVYKDSAEISDGQQLMGNLLFFVPRSLWTNKPDGSGQLVGEDFGLRFTNLSEPLPAEGYINFGIAGVAVYACFFAWFFARIDFIYWKRLTQYRSPISYVELVYPFGVGFTIFLMRGDFLSSTAYISGFALSAFIVARFAIRKVPENRK